MRAMIQKLNWGHIALLIAFPMVLGLINPNWLFNVYIIDDYIYLGYQLELPKFVGWSPSDDYYFIERISWIAPGYHIRQVLSPLLANFVIHLAVYYVAVFSVYGILARLFTARTALFTCLLMGQFSLFLRATGWDYMDGYVLALLGLTACLLTYAAMAPTMRARGYLMGAGATALVMVVAQPFYFLYLPALGIYYLALNHHHQRHHFLNALVFGGVGALVLFALQSGYYYALTGRWFLWQNGASISAPAITDTSWSQLLRNSYNFSFSSWQVFYLMTSAVALWVVIFPRRFKTIYGENTPHFAYHLKMTVVFLAGCYGVFGMWLLLDYDLYRLSFYSSTVLTSLFMVIGGLFAGRLYRLSEKQFREIILITLAMTLGYFALYTQLSVMQAAMMWLIAMLLALFTFIFAFRTKRQTGLVHLICAVTFFSYFSGVDVNYIGVFFNDRYANQRIYEMVTEAADHISDRYDDYSLESFRFWYRKDDPNMRTLTSLTSLYMHQWGRRILAMGKDQEPTSDLWDDNLYRAREIILITTELMPQEILADGNAILHPLGYELQPLDAVAIAYGDKTLQLVFTRLAPYAP